MSGRTWVPGDVAVRENNCEDRQLSLLVPRCAVDGHDSRPHWHHSGGGWDSLGGFALSTYRPPVVIDPEDSDDLDRLCKALVEAMYAAGDKASAANGVHPETVQAALRSLLVAKPEEPLGLGAVVRDDVGDLWVHVDQPGTTWRRVGGSFSSAHWSQINVSTPDQILSIGWVGGESA